MAQRVYLMGVAPQLLEQVQRFIDVPADRERICLEVARSAEVHQRAAAVSERVIASIRSKVRNADENPTFLYAANALPYFIAASDVDGVLSAVEWLGQARREPELEEFFSAQAAALGLACRKLRRDEYAAPDVSHLARAVAHYLGMVVDRHQATALIAAKARPNLWQRIRGAFEARAEPVEAGQVEDTEDLLTDYGISVWRALGMLFGRLGPAWWQGRDRWLGFLAYREDFKYVHVTVTEWKPGTPSSTTDVPSAPPTLPPSDAARELRALLACTSSLVPSLALAGWDRGLHPRGHSYGTCAFVDPAGARSLGRLLDGEPWADLEPYALACFGSAVEDWRVTVRTAARYAEKRNLYLLEGDEIFEYARRWPPL
jgi:hypothetical protein